MQSTYHGCSATGPSFSTAQGRIPQPRVGVSWKLIVQWRREQLRCFGRVIVEFRDEEICNRDKLTRNGAPVEKYCSCIHGSNDAVVSVGRGTVKSIV